jgi:hypothetical protein
MRSEAMLFPQVAMKRLLKEPMLHFLLLGAGIFFAYSLVSKSSPGSEPGKIVVTQGQIASMAEVFSRAWQRSPSADEMAGLVRDRVREEVYYREAIALGLQKDDTVIRRRLRQKMEFVSDDIAAQAEPTDAELSAYLQAHPESFGVEQRFTFRQVYLDPQKRGEHLTLDSARLLAKLKQARGESDLAAQGDPFALEHAFSEVPGSEVAKQFGKEFAEKLGKLPPGDWQGPLESGYGVHLVRVTARTEASAPALADVRDEVRRELTNARRLETNENIYQKLLKHYTVSIEAADPGVLRDRHGI